MKKIILFSLIPTIFLAQACAKSHTRIEDETTLKLVIKKYENTIEICTAEEKNRILPDKDSLQKMSKVEKSKIKDYILYRSAVNYKVCMLQNDAAPLEYFVALSKDKERDSASRKRARSVSEDIVSTHIIDKVNNISNLTSEELLYLKSIDYLNDSFDMVKVYDALSSYNSQNHAPVNDKK